MEKLMFIFGTRPEFIKLYPVIKEAQNRNKEVIIVNTGQHLEMVNDLLSYFKMEVDYDLKIMNRCNGLTDIVTTSISELDPIIKKENPDLVLVHGDTAATLAGSLASYFNQTKVGHIEAGLRTYNKYSPFPEEMNRQITGVIADYHFAPTEDAKHKLLVESKDEDSIFVVGNSAIDMLKYTINEDFKHPILDKVGDKQIILVTAHRRENLDIMNNLFMAINEIANKYEEDYEIVYPIHFNPQIRSKANLYLTAKNINVIEPLDPIAFHNIMKQSKLILTDSGGIQEEAPSLGKPVLVLRDTTERPEGVEAGTLKLVGTDKQLIVNETYNLLDNQAAYEQMQEVKNPYGDGTTSKQILDIIEKL